MSVNNRNIVVELFTTSGNERRAHVLAAEGKKTWVVRKRSEGLTEEVKPRRIDEALIMTRDMQRLIREREGKEIPTMIIDLDVRDRALRAKKKAGT